MTSNIEDTRPAEEADREETLLCLLQRVWTYSFTTKSDYSRLYADELAEAASRGFVTTAIVPGRSIYGRLWKVTGAGMDFLERFSDRIADTEVANYVESYITKAPEDA